MAESVRIGVAISIGDQRYEVSTSDDSDSAGLARVLLTMLEAIARDEMVHSAPVICAMVRECSYMPEIAGVVAALYEADPDMLADDDCMTYALCVSRDAPGDVLEHISTLPPHRRMRVRVVGDLPDDREADAARAAVADHHVQRAWRLGYRGDVSAGAERWREKYRAETARLRDRVERSDDEATS